MLQFSHSCKNIEIDQDPNPTEQKQSLLCTAAKVYSFIYVIY